MIERVKLIWDFRGPHAENTAAHHAIHLSEYLQIEGIDNSLHGSEAIRTNHHIAYMIVERQHMQQIRERLQPHRGHVYQEQ